MPITVEVRFKGNRKDYFAWPEEAERLYSRVPVIVEAERGLDFGRVGVVGEVADKKCAAGCGGCAVGGDTPAATKSVVRLATQTDIKAANDLRRSEEETRFRAVDRVRHHGLEMKLSDAEWQWDRKKLTFYFTAEKRVDFRDLVRDLATTFKARIELRQIGVRDEAARLGGVGRCGKEYCCSTWLRDLDPVSLAFAKDQHLSLNPAQISGGCGRLLCCLKYEHEFYVASRKRFPKEGKTVRTTVGVERVVAVDIFRERVFLRSEEHGPRFVLLADLGDEMARASEAPSEPLVARAEPNDPPAATRRDERRRPERPRPEQRRPAAAAPDPAPNPEPPREVTPGQQRDRPDRSEHRRRRDRPRPNRPTGEAGSEQAPRPNRVEPHPPAAASGEPHGEQPASADGQRRRKRRRRRGRRGGDGPGGGAPSSGPEA